MAGFDWLVPAQIIRRANRRCALYRELEESLPYIGKCTRRRGRPERPKDDRWVLPLF